MAHQLETWADDYFSILGYATYWVVGVSGLVIISLGLLNVLHRRPKDRYVWGYSINRISAGILLGVMGFTVQFWSNPLWM